MDSTYRQILRHASIFGAGAILFRLASIILLPVYTHYLTPTDYGVMALLDLTVNVLSVITGAGVAAAATRAHFDDATRHRDTVWWTAILSEIALAGLVIGPAFAGRGRLATVVFGSDLQQGSRYLAIALLTLWIGSITLVVDAYFRALKASSFVVGVGAIRLLINVVLNVSFLVHWRLGLAGILWGNLLSAVAALLIQLVPFVMSHRRVSFDKTTAVGYWRFGGPLVVFGLFSLAMHEADRYILSLFVSLRDLGLYSLAYQIGQAVNTLVLVPFSSIWSVLIYEIAKSPTAKWTYAQVFKYYVYGLSLVLLLAALFAPAALGLIAPIEYAPAAEIVPIICLAYFFFSLHDHFKVPAMLANRTMLLLPGVILAALVNVGLNFVLVPRYGALGAAWTSVVTYAVFAFVGLAGNRRIDRYPYPFGACAVAVVGLCATFAVHRTFRDAATAPVQIAVGAAMWLGWVVFLFGGRLRTVIADVASAVDFGVSGKQNADAVPEARSVSDPSPPAATPPVVGAGFNNDLST